MAESPRFVLVTGMSGAGKSHALRLLEDIGFYCIDNLPASLIHTIAELALHADHPQKQIAVCVDVRGGEDLQNLPAYLDEVGEMGIRPEVLFLESTDAILQQRYSETRRRHPASSSTGSVIEGIKRERELLAPVRARADLVVDTTSTSIAQLRERVVAVFQAGQEPQQMLITVVSFGFKNGLPAEADLVVDVRFLPNPYYDPALRPLTGEDAPVREFVLKNPLAAEFLERMKSMAEFLIPRYAAEPKSYLTICVGCTGGQHRSVAVARELYRYIQSIHPNTRIRHRDANRSGEAE
ncbi:MAG: RNase adapter RapZ [Candidatus Hydrogenedentes bacterium]|nr:RNase adapter RapZ [Candidatus Hydrogenedentota bacterium]